MRRRWLATAVAAVVVSLLVVTCARPRHTDGQIPGLRRLDPRFESGHPLIPFAGAEDGPPFPAVPAVDFDAAGVREAVYSSPVLEFEPFEVAVVSWNARHAADCGFGVEVSAAPLADGPFSPWLWIGEWNVAVRPSQRRARADGLRIDVDTLVAEVPMRALRLRVRARSTGAGEPRFALDRLSVSTWSAPDASPGSAGAVPTLYVPFRSQRSAPEDLASRVCSPTSLSMVLAYHGVDVSLQELAQRCYDPFHDIYGNWNRAIQAAYSFGVPGQVERLRDWSRAAECLEARRPLVISIAAKPGQLRGAPYASTQGHLLVLRGWNRDGRVAVNDPAAVTAAEGVVEYAREDLDVVWLRRGGTSYVLGD